MRGLTFIALAALLSACGGSATLAPTEADLARAQEQWPDASLSQLTAGHQTYRARCGSCHRLYAPGELPPESWPHAVAEMSDRARLNPTEQEATIRFLVAAALGSRALPSREASPDAAPAPGEQPSDPKGLTP